MKERPILFSAPMVRAILEGRKTQTRRTVKPQPELVRGDSRTYWRWKSCALSDKGSDWFIAQCPYGRIADGLWVKETWMSDPSRDGTWNHRDLEEKMPLRDIPERYRSEDWVIYRATWTGADLIGWKPSIFMPRWASRINLEITGIRVERLQEISEEDAIAEGIEGRWHPDDPKLWTWKDYTTSSWAPEPRFHYGTSVTPVSTYQGLWESINGKGSWDANPWVWVINFKRI